MAKEGEGSYAEGRSERAAPPNPVRGLGRCRRVWRVRGQVQGVGFRPFVYRLAQRCRLGGFVRNDGDGVTIEAEGPEDRLDLFAEQLETRCPPLALIDRISSHTMPAADRETGFRIETSGEIGTLDAAVTVDTAVCAECLAELLEPGDRRFRYGLINCTHCGPRYTIIRRVPYDRARTTMSRFAMCAPCSREYSDPLDRRFHAQPTACHDCGPRLELADPDGRSRSGDPVGRAASELRRGRILAIKGLGGFHLAVRADDSAAVDRLRRLKQRDAKPLAIMCSSAERAAELARLSRRALDLMSSPGSPIVLAPARRSGAVAPEVAGTTHRLGIMLPYTPVHHLLFSGETSAPQPLVMTSGNLSDEPLAIDNDEAVERLGPLCDGILWHDRPIARCVDDSVVIDMGDEDPLPVRRARGYAPAAIPLPGAGGRLASGGLCVGGELKNTAAVVRGEEAILSQHIGDLTHPLAFLHFKNTAADLEALFGVEPRWIAHDLHPLYLSTTYARSRAAELRVPCVPVQHHHAHAAAVLAEHCERGPALALVCDGVGYGPDGTIWGGELLVANLVDFRRLARLRPMRLAGGDRAAKDTRRCALALLHQALGRSFPDHPLAGRLLSDPAERQVLPAMIRRGVHCATSSAAGRVFDGVACLLGLCDHNDFEAQAALRLEAEAAEAGRAGAMPCSGELFRLGDDPAGAGLRQIDLAPLVQFLLKFAGAPGSRDVPALAALVHEQLALAFDAAVGEAAEATGLRRVALSGGVFLNQVLTERLSQLLRRRGLRVLRHRVVPPGDGGLSLGQAAVACARLERRAGDGSSPDGLFHDS